MVRRAGGKTNLSQSGDESFFITTVGGGIAITTHNITEEASPLFVKEYYHTIITTQAPKHHKCGHFILKAWTLCCGLSLVSSRSWLVGYTKAYPGDLLTKNLF
jgi:hypothetical protein